MELQEVLQKLEEAKEDKDEEALAKWEAEKVRITEELDQLENESFTNEEIDELEKALDKLEELKDEVEPSEPKENKN